MLTTNFKRLPSLEQLHVFASVANCSSFSQAAEKLHTSQATVSRQIKQLEDLIGYALINRNTRSVVITEHGRVVLEYATNTLKNWQNSHHQLESCTEDFTGNLHICAPELFAQTFLSQALAHFCLQYPNIRTQLTISEQPGNLLENGYDLAIKSGPLTDSSNYFAPLCKTDIALTATPNYLADKPNISHPCQLPLHQCFTFRNDTEWTFCGEDGSHKITPTPNIRLGTPAVLLSFILAGAGFSISPRWLVQPYLMRGQLQEVMSHYSISSLVSHFCEMNFIYPHKEPSAKLKAVMSSIKNSVNNGI